MNNNLRSFKELIIVGEGAAGNSGTFLLRCWLQENEDAAKTDGQSDSI